MSQAITIYHNPRCSKSRQALALLNEQGVEPEIVLYLKEPPDEAALQTLIGKLGITPRELLRKGEKAYKERGLADSSLSDAAIVKAMTEEPKLIERPIVVKGKRAILGRPPEQVLELV